MAAKTATGSQPSAAPTEKLRTPLIPWERFHREATAQTTNTFNHARTQENRSAIRPPRALLILGAPLNHAGRTQALRSGHPGMDAGIAAQGHGGPIAAGPRSNAGVKACRA